MNQIETDAETDDTDELEAQQMVEDETEEPEDSAEDDSEADDEASEEDDPGEFTVTLEGEDQDEGDDDSRENDTSVLRTLRKKAREDAKTIRELRKQVEARAKDEKPQLGPEPELADFDYDEKRFKAAHAEWLQAKRDADAAEEQARRAEEAQREAWDAKVSEYEGRKQAFGASDYDDAEEAVRAALSPQFMGIILDAVPDKPEEVIYALGKRDDLLKKFSEIDNPVIYVRELVKLSGKINVKPTARKPKPEERVRGGTTPPAAGEKQINRLREQAGTGKSRDLTEVIKQRKRMAAAGRR